MISHVLLNGDVLGEGLSPWPSPGSSSPENRSSTESLDILEVFKIS